jgi:hypothetical protein
MRTISGCCPATPRQLRRTLAPWQTCKMLGQLVAEVAAVRQDVTGVAGRLESLEDRFDRLDAFLRR